MTVGKAGHSRIQRGQQDRNTNAGHEDKAGQQEDSRTGRQQQGRKTTTGQKDLKMARRQLNGWKTTTGQEDNSTEGR